MKISLGIETLLGIFILSVIIFSLIYKNIDKTLEYSDCIYISVSLQTFTGSSLIDNNKKIRYISTIQIILSYIFASIVLSNLIS